VTGIEIFTNVKEPEQIGGTDAFLDLSNLIDVIVDRGGARYVPAARGPVQRPDARLRVIREEIRPRWEEMIYAFTIRIRAREFEEEHI
jgi:hypothetical protein